MPVRDGHLDWPSLSPVAEGKDMAGLEGNNKDNSLLSSASKLKVPSFLSGAGTLRRERGGREYG